ncbi:MAG: translation elongation factor-like protein [Candidatus Pacearchaeota archaeon]
MEKEIGRITHFFDKVSVAVIELSHTVRVGDVIHVKGSTTDFIQKIDSMQIEHEEIEEANSGDAIGLKVDEKVRPGDRVLLVQK